MGTLETLSIEQLAALHGIPSYALVGDIRRVLSDMIINIAYRNGKIIDGEWRESPPKVLLIAEKGGESGE